MRSVNLHLEYYANNKQADVSSEIIRLLASRREMLRGRMASLNGATGCGEKEWLERSYPVLSILAPVMSTHEEKIEFPGDPMCLYSALSYAVDQAVQTRIKGLDAADAPYNDLCPQWGYLPSAEYRNTVDASGIRKYDAPLLNTDQTVFDPRVWNDRLKKYFVDVVLKNVCPRVVLISAVSPAHRYAIDIARTVKEHLPDCIVVLGGRHADETVRFHGVPGKLDLAPSSPLTRIADGSVEQVFDFIVAGQGYYALDILMKAISLAMDVETKTVNVADVIQALITFAPLFKKIQGHALIVGLEAATLHVLPINGSKLHLHQLPSPYKAFAIRARFPVFENAGRILRTAHMMVTNACPFHCYFCSEGVTVVGEFLTFKAEGLERALERIVEYLDYGAEAIFFDDSIFWGGNIGHIINFCKEWILLRKRAQKASTPTISVFGREIECQRILDFVWGAQVTVDFLASRKVREEALYVLREMRAAGCTYMYMGIESMAAEVISRVHKNINHNEPWDQRVRVALGMARYAGIQVGSSVLFGLDGETQETITETIDKVEELVAEDLLMIASPNILTYHPNTEITHLHQMESKLDYHSANLDNRPPYVYFEEAFPAVISRNLTEEQIWHIHQQTQERWGAKRNSNPMPPTVIEESGAPL